MQAKIFIYRIIDICDELDVNRLKKQLKKLKIKPLGRRYFAPVYLNFATPPAEMEGRKWILKTFNLPVESKIKFYSLGTVTLRFELAIEADNYFTCFKNARHIINSPVFDQRTKTTLEQIKGLIKKEMNLSIRTELIEDYSILWIKEKYDVENSWLKKPVAQFLRNESLSLSQYEQDEACRWQFSYTPEDLTIIDWDRTVTIDAYSQEDVWDVLEYTNLQLVELRYYEKTLDKNLEQFYDALMRPYWKPIIGFYYASKMLKKLFSIYLNFSEVENRLNNFLRLTGDEYLSRIYLAASKRLNLGVFQESLKNRLADTEKIYEMLSGEASAFRAELLELTIVILIVLEIVLVL